MKSNEATVVSQPAENTEPRGTLEPTSSWEKVPVSLWGIKLVGGSRTGSGRRRWRWRQKETRWRFLTSYHSVKAKNNDFFLSVSLIWTRHDGQMFSDNFAAKTTENNFLPNSTATTTGAESIYSAVNFLFSTGCGDTQWTNCELHEKQSLAPPNAPMSLSLRHKIVFSI